MVVYSKLFASILDSSVWLESTPTRIVWLTLLAAKDQDGFARFASIDNLARRAVVSLAEAEAAVARLEAPDANSSNPDHEGRRIERAPGGWLVLNAKLYDEMVRRADELRLNRERVKRHRAKNAPADKADVPAAAPRPKRVRPAPPSDALEQLPKAIVDAVHVQWSRTFGAMDYGRLRKALKPIFATQADVYAAGQLVDAVEAFYEACQEDLPKWRSKWTPEKFAAEVHSWVKLGAMELVDEWGTATERGMAAGIRIGHT